MPTSIVSGCTMPPHRHCFCALGNAGVFKLGCHLRPLSDSFADYSLWPVGQVDLVSPARKGYSRPL